MKQVKTLTMTVVTTVALVACAPSAPQLGKASIDEVIAAMTPEEKAHFVTGTGMAGFSGDSAVVGETKSMVPGAAGTTYPIPRLGIPAIVLADGPAGLRISPTREGDSATYYCTHFPIGTLLASTWDTQLVEQVGKAIGNEALEYGADVLLAPALNIHRNPLCGRNFEYYSEDPLVAGEIAAAYVRGVQSNGVGTSVKHFAVNNQETNRMSNDSRVSQRALREIYLKGFEIAVKEAKPWTVMSSYNYVNGTYASENKDLLTSLLRDEWKFGGLVMTDWFAGSDAVAQIEAGNDLLEPGTEKQYNTLLDALKNGKIDNKAFDLSIRRILELIQETPRFKGYAYSNKPDLKAHAAITRQSATEGMVLLKNERKVLPLTDKVKNIALFGCTSYDFIAGGTGSGNVNRAYTVSLLDGLQNAGYKLDEQLKYFYEQYLADVAKQRKPSEDKLAAFLPVPCPEEPALDETRLRKLAAESDVALVTIGRTSGEFADRKVEEYELKQAEKQLLESVCKAFHAQGKQVVVVLNIGGVIETASWKNLPDAILLAWQAGQEGGNSVADILDGKVTPSGKLPMTFPVSYKDVPSFEDFPLDMDLGELSLTNHGEKKDERKNWDYTNYEEDIYVGYRYYDTYKKAVSYPFGYGLSYTTFSYAAPVIAKDGDGYAVTVEVSNTGKYAGKEIVQLYVSAPQDDKLKKPEQELKAFAKTPLLKPGEKATVKLFVKAADLASYDENSHSWIVDEGTYRFKVGASSRDIKAVMECNVDGYRQETGDILKPQVSLKRLGM